mgnify:FL=1|jgi:adenine-specific DNA-methyltransferase
MDYKKVPQQINDVVGDNVKKLAQLFPSAVKDGEVDFEALKEELGLFTEVGAEKYELTWAGKADAKRIAREDIVGKTLKYIPEDSKDADTTENLYIEGDNLEVLKLLRQNYYGAIKMIYIDPPYNTGKDFVYNDNFKMTEEEGLISDGAMDSQGERFIVNSFSQNRFHANWMNMMYPRLQIAKDLLKESGLIFISISDIEISNLRILCDEIFGASNFVVDLIWANKEGGGSSDSKLFRIKHEHILCYAKNIAEVEVIGIPVGNEDRYKSEDEYVKERGKYYLQKLGMGSIQYSQSLDYPIEVPDGTTVMPADNNGGKKACWRWSKQKYEWGKANGFIEIKKDGSGQWTVYTKQYLNCDNDGNIIERTQRPMGIIDEYSSTQAAKMLESMGLGKYFNYSKPYDLIKYLISRIDCDNEIIMDFFSGSGTTAHSVICSNEEDHKRRKFILVQFPELLDENTDAYQEGFRTICDLGKERIRSVEERMNISSACDTGFKVFRVADTNIKWNSLMNMGQLDVSQIESTPDLMDFMPNTKDIDVVYELMLRQRDVALSESVELLSDIGKRTYLYASSFLVCLETEVTAELVEKIASIDPLPIKFIFRDSAFKDDIALKDETFRRLKALVEKNSGESKPTYTVEFI